MSRARGEPPPWIASRRVCWTPVMQTASHALAKETLSRALPDATPDACRQTQVNLKLLPLAPVEASRRVIVGWPVGMAILVALVTALFVWGWIRGSDARVLARLPADERARLFQLTWSKAEAVCAEPGLEDRCHGEVELLSEFPECGVDCQAFIARHRPRGSR